MPQQPQEQAGGGQDLDALFSAAFADKKKAETKAPPASPKSTPATTKSADGKTQDLDQLFSGVFAAKKLENQAGGPPPDKHPGRPSEVGRPDTVTGVLTGSVVKTATGYGAADVYDKIASRFPSLDSSFTGQLARELVRGAPEVLDAATSPAGLALVGAHIFPASRPFAFMADTALGMLQMGKTIPSVIEAANHLDDPVKVASAIKDLVYSYGLVKTGKAGSKKLGPEAFKGDYDPTEAQKALKEFERLKPRKSDKKEVRQKKTEQRMALWRQLNNPEDKKQQRLLSVYRSPLKHVAGMVSVKLPTVLEVGRDMIEDRNNFINLENMRMDRLVNKMTSEIPEAERDVQRLGYVMQGDATADEAGLSEKTRKLLPQIDEWRRNEAEMLRQAWGGKISLQEADQYLSQRWKFDKKDPRSASSQAEFRRRLMKDPHLRERKIQGYKEGIEEHGLEPAQRDVAQIMKDRHKTAVTAIANAQLANRLHEMDAIVTGQRARKLGLDHWPAAPDAPTLYRAAFKGKSERTKTVEKPGEDPFVHTKETVRMKDEPIKVNPDIKLAVDAVFANPASFPGFAAVENVRAYTKMNAVMWSLFHNWALSEQAQAELGGANKWGKAAKSFFFANPEFYKGMKAGIWETVPSARKYMKTAPDAPIHLRMAPDIVEPWVKDGARWSSTDAENAIIKSLRNVTAPEKFGKPGKAAAAMLRTFGNAGYVQNKALWDYHLPASYMAAAEAIFNREWQRVGPNGTPAQASLLRKNISRHLNEAFGTTSMETMLLHPKMRQALNFLFFAPAWTLSNIRILTSGYENEIQRRLRDKWIRGAAISWLASTELFNYALSSYYGGTDKNGKKHAPGSAGWFSWDNAGAPLTIAGKDVPGITDNSINIFAGYNPDGSQRFIRFGKGFREPFSWVMAPIQTLGGKLSLPVRAAITQVTGVEPGSDFQVINPKGTATEQAFQRVSEVAKLFTPFTLDTTARNIERTLLPEIVPEPGASQLFSLPTVKGITKERAIKAYEQAMKENRSDLAQLVLKAATINGLNTNSIIAGYKTRQTLRRKTKAGPQQRYDTSGRPVAPPR